MSRLALLREQLGTQKPAPPAHKRTTELEKRIQRRKSIALDRARHDGQDTVGVVVEAVDEIDGDERAQAEHNLEQNRRDAAAIDAACAEIDSDQEEKRSRLVQVSQRHELDLRKVLRRKSQNTIADDVAHQPDSILRPAQLPAPEPQPEPQPEPEAEPQPEPQPDVIYGERELTEEELVRQADAAGTEMLDAALVQQVAVGNSARSGSASGIKADARAPGITSTAHGSAASHTQRSLQEYVAAMCTAHRAGEASSIVELFAANMMLNKGSGSFATRPNDTRELVIGVTRALEESMLREPIQGEEPCTMGDQCEGRFIPGAVPITLVAFVAPEEFTLSGPHRDPATEVNATNTTNAAARATLAGRMCVMCTRKAVGSLFQSARSKSLYANMLCQRYHNFVNQDGEYALDQCICNGTQEWQGIYKPVAVHVRHWYRQERRRLPNGTEIYCYAQHGYLYPLYDQTQLETHQSF